MNGEPKVLNLKEMLQHYIDYQCEVVVRRTRYELRKAQERAHIVEALKVAIDFIDEVIAIIRSSKTIAESKERLMERFQFDDAQATCRCADAPGPAHRYGEKQDRGGARRAQGPHCRFVRYPLERRAHPRPSSRRRRWSCATNTSTTAAPRSLPCRARWTLRTSSRWRNAC